MGVIGMNLVDDDEVIGMQMNTQGDDLLLVSEYGLGKRTAMNEFTPQYRGGKGVRCYKLTEKTGNLVGMKAVMESHEIMLISTEGIIIRMPVEGISRLGRNTSGVKLISLDLEKDITVASIAKVRESEKIEEEVETE
jgi:DNA gyrase subunit A